MIDWNHVDELVPDDIRTVLVWLEPTETCHPHVESLFGGFDFGWYARGQEYWYAGDNGAQKAHDEGQLSITYWAELTSPALDKQEKTDG